MAGTTRLGLATSTKTTGLNKIADCGFGCGLKKKRLRDRKQHCIAFPRAHEQAHDDRDRDSTDRDKRPRMPKAKFVQYVQICPLGLSRRSLIVFFPVEVWRNLR